jgi:hypothetical protein
MPRIACHFPITVTLSGDLSAAQLEDLGRAVEAALAERLRLAQDQLGAAGAAGTRAVASDQEAPAEPTDSSRVSMAPGSYLIPSYDDHGALREAALRPANDPATLSDAQLRAEYEQTREWLLKHRIVESGYGPMREYFDLLEREVSRRNARPGEPSVPMPPAGPRPTAPPPAMFAADPSAPAAGDVPAPITAAHAGAALGEREVAFALGQRGFRFVISPTGPGAHALTGSGFDSVAYNHETSELWLIDNKASGALGKAEGKKATALGQNLEASLDEAVTIVRGMPDFPDKPMVLRKLEDSLGAVRQGRPIPPALNVKLKVTAAGGYAGGARNLPSGVEFEDVVGPEIRETRRTDIAEARREGVRPGRPSGHAETEAMRQQTGGVQSREPVRTPRGVGAVRRISAAGRSLVPVAAALVWNVMMTKLEQRIENKVLRGQVDEKLRALEPAISTRLNDQAAVMADLQLRQPGKPLFGNVSVLITVYRDASEDETLLGCDLELVSVSISAAKVEHSERSRIWVGSWVTARAPRDLIRSTFSVELEPLSKPDLRVILLDAIAAEESAAGGSSLPTAQQRASQRRRDELAAQLRQLESADGR